MCAPQREGNLQRGVFVGHPADVHSARFPRRGQARAIGSRLSAERPPALSGPGIGSVQAAGPLRFPPTPAPGKDEAGKHRPQNSIFQEVAFQPREGSPRAQQMAGFLQISQGCPLPAATARLPGPLPGARTRSARGWGTSPWLSPTLATSSLLGGGGCQALSVDVSRAVLKSQPAVGAGWLRAAGEGDTSSDLGQAPSAVGPADTPSRWPLSVSSRLPSPHRSLGVAGRQLPAWPPLTPHHANHGLPRDHGGPRQAWPPPPRSTGCWWSRGVGQRSAGCSQTRGCGPSFPVPPEHAGRRACADPRARTKSREQRGGTPKN